MRYKRNLVRTLFDRVSSHEKAIWMLNNLLMGNQIENPSTKYFNVCSVKLYMSLNHSYFHVLPTFIFYQAVKYAIIDFFTVIDLFNQMHKMSHYEWHVLLPQCIQPQQPQLHTHTYTKSHAICDYTNEYVGVFRVHRNRCSCECLAIIKYLSHSASRHLLEP